MTLNPGDLMFVGFDADNNDIGFITTVDIPAGEIIYFSDDEWDGTAFNGTEQLMEWIVPVGGVSAGTVVSIDMDTSTNSVTFSSGGAVDHFRGGYQIAQGNEMFWAYQGTRVGDDVTPTNFIAVIGNEADGTSNQTPNLTGTGLTTSNGAIIIDGDEDYMEWTADGALPDPVQRQALIDSISDLGNWTTADGSGNNNPNGTGFTVDTQNVVCFARGTRIHVAGGGTKKVEDLRVGDLVCTMDGVDQPIRWIGGRMVSREDFEANPNLRPVRISARALGNNLPLHDLLVSRQHRMLVASKIVARMFGAQSVLIAAHRLMVLPGIHVDDSIQGIEYFHLLFDDHEVVFAEGAPTESLFLGQETIKTVCRKGREEILTLFPELTNSKYAPRPARHIPAGRQQTRLVARHAKNEKPVLM